jgi:hypothetical protein
MYYLGSERNAFELYPQKQNMRASKMLDFPDPLLPIIDVNFIKGPIYCFPRNVLKLRTVRLSSLENRGI